LETKPLHHQYLRGRGLVSKPSLNFLRTYYLNAIAPNNIISPSRKTNSKTPKIKGLETKPLHHQYLRGRGLVAKPPLNFLRTYYLNAIAPKIIISPPRKTNSKTPKIKGLETKPLHHQYLRGRGLVSKPSLTSDRPHAPSTKPSNPPQT
jgi:hypothetical protein